MNKEITESLELIGRSLSRLAVLAKKGDLTGHPFRGNQWSGGQGGQMAPDVDMGSGVAEEPKQRWPKTILNGEKRVGAVVVIRSENPERKNNPYGVGTITSVDHKATFEDKQKGHDFRLKVHSWHFAQGAAYGEARARRKR